MSPLYSLVMQEAILKSIRDGRLVLDQLEAPEALTFIQEVSELFARVFNDGGKLLVAGNGGSLCDAMHFAEELTGQFRAKRPALPAIALSDPGHLTCVANDMGFDEVFARGIEAFGKPDDIFVGLTTSGNSPNMIRAFEEAKQKKLATVAFLGKGGGELKGIADHELIIDGFSTSDRIQEAHMLVIHTIIEMVELTLFSSQCPVYVG